jgi:phosphatidate cytidylyltransferase
MLPIFAITVPGFVLGAIVMALSGRHAAPDVLAQRWLKLGVFFLIVHVVLGMAALGGIWVTVMMTIIVGAGAYELLAAWKSMDAPRPAAVWPVYALTVAVVLYVSVQLPPAVFAFVFLVTAATDGFSQVSGDLIGRHKLAPRISPAKTIEGMVAGILAGIGVALLARRLLLGWSVSETAGLALVTALTGLAGDLAASWIKRRAHIKDYSNALPGQGGFLDRFDSLLGAMTLVGPTLVMSGF